MSRLLAFAKKKSEKFRLVLYVNNTRRSWSVEFSVTDNRSCERNFSSYIIITILLQPTKLPTPKSLATLECCFSIAGVMSSTPVHACIFFFHLFFSQLLKLRSQIRSLIISLIFHQQYTIWLMVSFIWLVGRSSSLWGKQSKIQFRIMS